MKKLIAATLSVILSVSSLSNITFAANKEFKDVASGDWFYKDVQNLAGLGAISGFNDGTFKPESTITRAEFVKILVTALKLESSPGNSFSDTKDHWANNSISTAVSNGIILQSEFTNGFEPDKPINRLEMAKMMLRALKVNPADSASGPFSDTTDGYTAAAYNEYLIMGTIDGGGRYFYPQANATRAEASAIIVRAVDYSKDSNAYKTQKIKELKDKASAGGFSEDLSIEDRGSTVQIENVQSLPDVVQISSPEEYARKIMTAVYLKKLSITIKVSKYNENDYGVDSILKSVKEVEFEKCYQKGYSAGYQANISIMNNSADIKLDFTYSDLDVYETSELVKVYTADDFRKALKKAILNQQPEVNVAIKDYDPQSYNLEKVLAAANDESVMSKGYCAKYQGSSYLDSCGSRVIYIDLYFSPLSYKLSDLTRINSYDEFVSALSDCVKNKKRLFNVLISNYDSETYNLASTLIELNKELSKSGYCAKVLNKSVENTTPTIYHILFTYPAYTEGTTPEGDKDVLVLKNEKEWYNAVENALSNSQDVIKYDFIYSSEMGDIISKVLQMNPDLDYANKWMTSSSEIRFYYRFPKDKLLDMKEKTEQKAKQIISEIIKPGMTETEKAKAIHDYIVINAKYDYENYKNDTIPEESYTAYGILINGTGVCEGYAAAFNLLAKLAGIESIGVTGTANGGPHAWNMVRLDGKVGYIDTTWDDPVPDRDGQVRYDYFNVSAEKLAKDHKWDTGMFSEKYLDY